MILQQLEIHNIASIENANIDFEAQPLADSEVFLITGKTGAGKSTILDAICLALYANTPRLDNTLMQGETKDQEKEIKIKDPVQLMRRNTGEAHVALTFTGSNGTHYEAIWSVARARNKVTGKIQSKKWSLHNLDTDFTYTKDKEIREEIARAIGLDFKQFCRTTLLAQGEFTRFLNSKDDEKAEILEKITGVDAYSKIGKKIWDKTAEMHRAWDESKLGIEGIQVMSDETIASKQEELKQLDQQLAGLKTEADKISQARSWENNIQLCQQDIAQQEKALTNLAQVFHRLMLAQKLEQEKEAEIAGKIEHVDNFLQSKGNQAKVYENAPALIEQLRSFDAHGKQITENQTSVAKIQKEKLEVCQPALEKEQKALADKRKEYEQLAHHIKQEEASLDSLNLPILRQQSEALRTLLGDLSSTRTLLSTQADGEERIKLAQQHLSEAATQIAEKQKQAAVLVPALHDAEVKKQVLKDAYEKQRESINKWAKSIRMHLAIGDTCPVCQQKITSALPHEDVIDALVAEAEKMTKKAEQDYEQKMAEKNAIDANIKAMQTSYENNSKALDKEKANLIIIKDKAQKASEYCIKKINELANIQNVSKLKEELQSVNNLEEEAISVKNLDIGEQKIQEILKNLSAEITRGEEKEKAVRALHAQEEKLRKKGEEQRDKVQKAEKQLDDCDHQIKVFTSLIQQAKAEQEKIRQKVAEVIDFPEVPLDYANQLKADADEYNRHKIEMQKLMPLQEKYKLTNEHVASGMKNILELMPVWATNEGGNPSDKTSAEFTSTAASSPIDTTHLLESISDLQNQVVTIHTQIKTSKQSLEENKKLWENFLTSQELSETLQDEISQTSEDKINQTSEDKISQTLQDKISPSSEDKIGQILQDKLAELEASQKELSDNRGGIMRDLQVDRENKEKMGALIAESEKKKAEYEKWSRLNQLLGDAQGNRFRRIAQSYVLASLIHSANAYMRTLTDRYILKVVPGSFVITMEDAYQGYASRAASTLSGGESFLVSLSLALALSDIGNQLSVDTLFIDEGFGTLSGEPLQHAINTLRSLHNKSGRHVGIISHVEELKERIPVQIRVNQEGNNSSSTIEVVG